MLWLSDSETRWNVSRETTLAMTELLWYDLTNLLVWRVQCYIILYYIILSYLILSYIILYYIILYHILLYDCYYYYCYLRMYVCICVCVGVCVCLCIYIYIYMYMYSYLYLYTYVHRSPTICAFCLEATDLAPFSDMLRKARVTMSYAQSPY